MSIIKRLIARLRFRKTIKSDESTNVVKAGRLYEDLCLAAHPDEHPEKLEIAQNLTQRITANRHNYAALVALRKEIEETLK